jgi:hypothetical protein
VSGSVPNHATKVIGALGRANAGAGKNKYRPRPPDRWSLARWLVEMLVVHELAKAEVNRRSERKAE